MAVLKQQQSKYYSRIYKGANKHEPQITPQTGSKTIAQNGRLSVNNVAVIPKFVLNQFYVIIGIIMFKYHPCEEFFNDKISTFLLPDKYVYPRQYLSKRY